MSEPRILLLDIETLPDLKEVMKVMPQLSAYPGLTLKASINSIICIGYRWSHERDTKVICAWDYPQWDKDVNDDGEVLRAFLPIIERADIVATHNGKRFDWKFIQTRIIKHNLTPIKKTTHIDTCQLAKQHLYLFNNRLSTLAKFMTDTDKLENGGWELWEQVLNRDEKAMRLMARYCKRDVDVLHAVFKKLKPFMVGIPNMNIYREGEEFVCPKCGSTRIEKRGTGHNKSGPYLKFHCYDCLSWSSAKNESKEPKAI